MCGGAALPQSWLRLSNGTPPQLEPYIDDPAGLKEFVESVLSSVRQVREEEAQTELIDLYFEVGRPVAYARRPHHDEGGLQDPGRRGLHKAPHSRAGHAGRRSRPGHPDPTWGRTRAGLDFRYELTGSGEERFAFLDVSLGSDTAVELECAVEFSLRLAPTTVGQ